MRKYYIFSYASGLTTSTGFAGYHGRFSIAGKLAIFSTKQKAVDHMDRMTSSEPSKKHVLMSKANARKHFLGDTVEEFNNLIKKDIDLYAPEEDDDDLESEKDFDETEEIIIGVFTVASLKYVEDEIEYIGNYSALFDHTETIRPAILTTCNKYFEYPTAIFNKRENAKNKELLTIFPTVIDERMKIIPTEKEFIFFLENITAGMTPRYIKVIIED